MKDKNEIQLSISNPITLETRFGLVNIRYISSEKKEGILVFAEKPFPNPIPVRVQSSCLFSESLLSLDCDCAAQLHASLEIITSEGGLLIYLYEEGRGAGLLTKIEAIRLQQQLGIDTASAYRKLGIAADLREYKIVASVILSTINSNQEIELITNNPAKIKALQDAGVNIVRRRPLVLRTNDMVKEYLLEKGRVLGHLLEDE